ncbi:ComEC/Rec2 family competence protein [Candidatus Uhrbacteria bacterium]|nr:ComEC/Rec2 family competence protein [Candidatus Uhrbacteria bacterium]
MEWLAIGTGMAIVLLFLSSKPAVRYSLFVLLALMLGLWRFEASTIPRNLRFLNPSGFAYERAAPNPYRDYLSDRIHQGLPGDEGALLSGILYGERSLTKESRDAFRTAGMSHLVAVSGSNVMLVVLAAMHLFGLFHLSRRKTFLLLTGVLVAFVWLVSPQAPVVRAAIMGWLIALAPVVGRLPSTKRLLLVAAALFAAWKPWSLVYDPSFALSFLATAGLMTWGKYFDDYFEKRIPWTSLREGLSMTLAATLMTTPYAAWAFGQTTIVGVVTNLLALPLIPWAMGSGLVALALPFEPFTLPAKGFLSVLLWIANTAQGLGWGSWSGLGVTPWFMIACYIVIWWAWRKLSTYK